MGKGTTDYHPDGNRGFTLAEQSLFQVLNYASVCWHQNGNHEADWKCTPRAGIPQIYKKIA